MQLMVNELDALRIAVSIPKAGSITTLWRLTDTFRSLWDLIHTPIEGPEDSEPVLDFPDENWEFDIDGNPMEPDCCDEHTEYVVASHTPGDFNYEDEFDDILYPTMESFQ